jgi:uncharacterized protein (DUF433 family)
VVREVEARVEGLSRRSPDQFGQVTRNRYIMNGHPILAGTRIPTASISRLIEKGYSQAFLLEQFPRLTSKDIEGAVRFEASQRRNVAAN